jgi:hypothetical protein
MGGSDIAKSKKKNFILDIGGYDGSDACGLSEPDSITDFVEN